MVFHLWRVQCSLQVSLDPLGCILVHVARSIVGTISFEVGESFVSPAVTPRVLDLPEGTLVEEGLLGAVHIVQAVSWIHGVKELSSLWVARSSIGLLSSVEISNLDFVVSTLSLGVVSNHSHLMVSSTGVVAHAIALLDQTKLVEREGA